jgi:restriction endonuclease S subunit
MNQLNTKDTDNTAMPTNWTLANFEETCKPTSDGGKKTPQKAYLKNGKYPIIDQGEQLIGGFTDDTSMLFDGNLPVIAFGDHTRRFKFIDQPFAVGADGVKLITPTAAWNAKCLWYFFHAVKLEDRGYSRHFQYLRKSKLPLPPIPEQIRIVAKLDELLSDLDAGIAALERAQANLKRYRASVLKAAVEGRLTAKWRKQNSAIETGAQLLARILKERRAKWEENQLKKFTEQGKTPPKNWQDKYPEPAAPDIAGLPELPKGWAWVSLGHLAWSIKDGPHYSPKYSQTGVPFISGGNIRPEGIDFSTAKYISSELHAELSKRCKPEIGDVLYTKGGTTGIARVNTEDRDFNVWVHVAVLKLIDSLHRFYVQHALNSPHCYHQAQKYTHGVGNQDLGLTRMVWITLPIPPVAEQAEIVAEIDRSLSVVDATEKTIESALARATRLRQAILKRAFEGRLVPQDPNDEPASVLLERIRAERLPQSPSQRVRKNMVKNLSK